MLANIASTFRYATTSAFTVFLFLCLVAYTHYSFMSYQNTQERIHQIHLVGDTILYYDEVLTMSARMSAITGDKSWQKRYDEHLPLLDAAIDRAYHLVDAAKTPMEKTKEANDMLVTIEAKAFWLVNVGQQDEALQLLFDEEYLTNKQVYAEGFAEMMQILNSSKDQLTAKRNSNITLAAAISIITFCVIVFNIIVTFRRLRLDNTLLEKQLDIIDRYVISSSTNARGIITAVSEAFCKISGYSRDELIGKSHNILRHTDMPKETFTQLWQSIKNKKVWHGEIKIEEGEI